MCLLYLKRIRQNGEKLLITYIVLEDEESAISIERPENTHKREITIFYGPIRFCIPERDYHLIRMEK